MAGRERDGREPTERHADHDGAGMARARVSPWQRPWRCRRASTARSSRQSECPCPGRSTATSGRSSARATVSHVWAFWAPPCTSTRSGSASPHTRALTRRPSPASTNSRRTAGGPSPRDVVLLGVLLEEPELVVLDGRHVVSVAVASSGFVTAGGKAAAVRRNLTAAAIGPHEDAPPTMRGDAHAPSESGAVPARRPSSRPRSWRRSS